MGPETVPAGPGRIPRRLTGRPTATRRVGSGVAGLLLIVVALLLLLQGNLWGLLVLLAGFYGVSELRRKVVVESDLLIVQGRVTRRTTRLSTLNRIGISTMARAWVAPRDGRPFYLRMLIDEAGWASPGVWEFVPLLRERAMAAGARLQPEPGERTEPPPGVAPWFSA